MKIEIVTTVRAVEMTNYLLAQAIKSAENSKEVWDSLGISEKDLKVIKGFRKKLVDSLLRTNNK